MHARVDRLLLLLLLLPCSALSAAAAPAATGVNATDACRSAFPTAQGDDHRALLKAGTAIPFSMIAGREYYDVTCTTVEPYERSSMCTMEAYDFLFQNGIQAEIVDGKLQLPQRKDIHLLPENPADGTVAALNQTLIEKLFSVGNNTPVELAWQCLTNFEECCGIGCCQLVVESNRKPQNFALPWLVINNDTYYDQTAVVVRPKEGDISCAVRTMLFLTENNVSPGDFHGIITPMVAGNIDDREFFVEIENATDIDINKTLIEHISLSTYKPAELAWHCNKKTQICCGTRCCPIESTRASMAQSLSLLLLSFLVLLNL